MSRVHNLYIGRSGQLAVMAEFLARGYNVAVPEVDRGDDIFVVKDEDGDLSRIQVKTAVAREGGRGFAAKFSVLRRQLDVPTEPDLNYVLAVRRAARWDDFIIISRKRLLDEHANYGAGSIAGSNVVFSLSSSSTGLQCSGRDWQPFRNNWAAWPVIAH